MQVYIRCLHIAHAFIPLSYKMFGVWFDSRFSLDYGGFGAADDLFAPREAEPEPDVVQQAQQAQPQPPPGSAGTATPRPSPGGSSDSHEEASEASSNEDAAPAAPRPGRSSSSWGRAPEAEGPRRRWTVTNLLGSVQGAHVGCAEGITLPRRPRYSDAGEM